MHPSPSPCSPQRPWPASRGTDRAGGAGRARAGAGDQSGTRRVLGVERHVYGAVGDIDRCGGLPVRIRPDDELRDGAAGNERDHEHRLHDGTLDTGWGGDGIVDYPIAASGFRSVALRPDGSAWVVGDAGGLALYGRLTPAGAWDVAFMGDGWETLASSAVAADVEIRSPPRDGS